MAHSLPGCLKNLAFLGAAWEDNASDDIAIASTKPFQKITG